MSDGTSGSIPTVSVVTRTKDRPLLLRRSIQSCLSQTLNHWELVVINDGGNPTVVDEVVNDAVQEAADRHSDAATLALRIRIVHREESGGMESASNAGIAASDSRYIAILDDDDRWDARFLESTVAAAEAAGAMGAVSDTMVILETLTDTGTITERARFPFDPTPGSWMTPRPPTDLYRLIGWNQFPPCAFVYRRSAMEEIGGYDESLPVLGDWEFNLRFFPRFNVVHVPEMLAYYHHRTADTGASGNSVHAGEALHDRVRLQILDSYLRRDLSSGNPGVGLLANLLLDQREERLAVHRTLDDLAGAVGDLQRLLEQLEQRVKAQAPPGILGRALRRGAKP